MGRWRVLSLFPLPADRIRPLLGDLPERVDLKLLFHPTQPELHAALADAELVLAAWQGTHPQPFDAAAVAAAGPHLAFVQQPSVGTDSVDLEALAARGVPVANTAGANARSVAEWALGATICVARSMAWADRAIRAGGWPQMDVVTRSLGEIAGLRVGVLGFGSVGSLAASLFAACGCEVAYWSRRPRPEAPYPWLEVPALCARSDVLLLCLPRTPETQGLIGVGELATLPAGAIVIDVGRGGVLDREALLTALDSGHLSGTALDVHPTEPLSAEDPLRRHDRVLLSPHAAGATGQAVTRVIGQSLANIRRVLDGQPVHDVVNGISPVVTRRNQ
jgi:D-3-phosphoglycerate dehydrogenase